MKIYPNGIYIITLILMPLYIYSFVIRPLLESTIYITSIEVLDTQITFDYLKYNTPYSISINPTTLTYSIKNQHKNSLSDRIILYDKKIRILTQYFISMWTKDDIKTLESILIKEGVKKPFGENL
jgi:hypothetical protein